MHASYLSFSFILLFSSYSLASVSYTHLPVICIIMKDISVKGKISVEKQGEVLTDVKKDGKGNVQFVYEDVYKRQVLWLILM